MVKGKKATLVALLCFGFGAGLGGCSSTTDPDMVGLYYLQGSSDGNHFDHCTKSGQTDDYEWNNQIIYLGTGMRYWRMTDDPGGDAPPLILSTKPKAVKPGEPPQPSGLQVKVELQVTMKLNTYCDKNGGVVRLFWETIGRSSKADKPEGWKAMMEKVLATVLVSTAKDEIRSYDADALVNNADNVQGTVIKNIGPRVKTELERLSGGPFFCGPSFDQAKPDCPQLELAIIGVEYADAGIQASRNEKQKQIELAAAAKAKAEGEAAALVAEAKGKADAAAQLDRLYKSPAWVALQEKIIAADALVKACQAAKECTIVVGADGSLIMK